jgi:diacylglycerol kinase (ATP)
VVNLVTQEYHPIARVAKNVAAGAVLVTSMISVFVGYLIFSERILNFRPEVVRHSLMNSHLIIFSLVVVISLVIMTKAFGGHTRFLQGGMPSGHAAVGFSIATAIFLVGEGFVVVLGYVLAILLAQSRVEGKIHTLWEVIVGAILGTLVTLLFFQLKG